MNCIDNIFELTLKTIEEELLLDISQEIKERIATRISTRITDMKAPIGRLECSKLLGVSLPTLDRYIREEGIPYRVKNPHAKSRIHYIFLTNEVLEWQQSRLSDLCVNHRRSN